MKMTDAAGNVENGDPVELVMTTLCSDFEHSIDQSGEDFLPLVDVEEQIRYTDKQVNSFVILLNNGQKVKVTGKLMTETWDPSTA